MVELCGHAAGHRRTLEKSESGNEVIGNRVVAGGGFFSAANTCSHCRCHAGMRRTIPHGVGGGSGLELSSSIRIHVA